MNKIVFFLVLSTCTIRVISVDAQDARPVSQLIPSSVSEKYQVIRNTEVAELNDLVTPIRSVTTDKKEQLQLLLLWVYDNMNADAERFINSGYPMSVRRSLVNRKGLCDEFSGIVDEFCKAVQIKTIKVPGYVKYPEFKASTGLKQTNHAWNLVYIDSWLACDLFWSIVELDKQGRFVKRLALEYFLTDPDNFLKTHLPADPVFQFKEHPITPAAFARKSTDVATDEEPMPYLNFTDSINALLNMKPDERSIRMAEHSYAYNKQNPNEVIKESFNAGVSIINSGTLVKVNLVKAQKHFNRALSLIEFSKDPDIRELKQRCIKGLSLVDQRLPRAR